MARMVVLETESWRDMAGVGATDLWYESHQCCNCSGLSWWDQRMQAGGRAASCSGRLARFLLAERCRHDISAGRVSFTCFRKRVANTQPALLRKPHGHSERGDFPGRWDLIKELLVA